MLIVTVITVCRNNLEGLKRTCESVWNQTKRDEIEHIVIDGASTDGTREWLEQNSGKIDRWVSEPDDGIYNAMNKGTRIASGEYCLFLNSGDEFAAEDVIELSLPFLDGTDVVYGNLQMFNPKNGAMRLWSPSEVLTASYFLKKTLPHPASFIRRQILKLSPYNENYKIVSDLLFFAKSIVFDGATSKKMHHTVSVFYEDGISSLNESATKKERHDGIKELYPTVFYNDLKELVDLKEEMTNLPGIGLSRNVLKVRRHLGRLKRKIFGKSNRE